MDKEFLEECLADGLSLEAIGKRVGKHESTVSYWLKKHGLAAARAEKHGAKGAPSKDELARLLRLGMSLREIAKEMDRSLATVPPRAGFTAPQEGQAHSGRGGRRGNA